MSDANKITAKYEVADIKLIMTTYYERLANLAKDYLAKSDWNENEPFEEIDLGTEFYEEYRKELLDQINSKYEEQLQEKFSDEIKRDIQEKVSYETIEYVLTGSMFNRILLTHEGIMLHSSAVVVDGYAYLFSADSGVGKSTHTDLWLKHFGEDAYIINDDKPAIRNIDGEWYVYGTPWCGKHNTNKNAKAKLGAIVFLERSEENWIEEETIEQAIKKFFKQTVRKLHKEENMDLVLSAMERVLTNTPIYKMGCNISDEAVELAYKTIRRK